MIVKLIRTSDLIAMCDKRPALRADLDLPPIYESIRSRGFEIDTEKSHMIRVVDGVLVDGERRIRAAAALGIDWLPVEFETVTDADVEQAVANVTTGPLVGIPDDAEVQVPQTDLDKFKEFFKQFGITLEPAYNKGSYNLEGPSVTKHRANMDILFNQDGSYEQIDIET